MNSVPSLYYYNRANEAQDASTEIVDGLRATQKYISPKFFYDEHGSALFTEITRQPEYYPTRTETRLLEAHANEISELIGDDSLLIEYVSRASAQKGGEDFFQAGNWWLEVVRPKGRAATARSSASTP